MSITITRARIWQILLVEDNPADIRLTEEALRLCDFNYKLSVARDGERALMMLRGGDDDSTIAWRPDLVLLDLNLPRKDGREVLAEIKNDPRLAQIPVLVLSTSVAEHDVAACYRLHANCYMQKPTDFEDFAALVRSIREFWLGRVRLPSRVIGVAA